ncbi:MAG: precorrin-3B C(17)-methyltransferase [Methanomassiliicoccus sp.]|nr:precorrin-3B C(17)-methyltransferase [Methanomassiliicoccus sp.]
MSQSRSQDETKGKLYVVSTGPGDLDNLTPLARKAITESEVIIGNQFYLEQMQPLLEGKKVINSHMGREVDRAREAVHMAIDHKVAMVSGGDAGVYGMASIVLELAQHEAPGLEVKIVPGVTAATAAASILGSPLSSDFLIISLSDLLTPWEVIEKRLDLGFQMGIPMAVYNPRSHNRPSNLRKALEIGLRHAKPDTPVGIVRNAYRGEGESCAVTDLGSLYEDDSMVDMHSMVIIGGEGTRLLREGEHVKGIITPRGYHRKYVY